MQLDECVRLPAPRARDRTRHAIVAALGGALAAARSKRSATAGRALFGIVQGGDDPALRVESARALIDIGFEGYAIGGLAVGESPEVMRRDDRRDRAGIARRPAALSDGRRDAGGHPRGGRARHRHVRLRDADAQRPPRRRLHAFRSDQPQERAPRRRSAAARRGKSRSRPRATIRAPICITWSRAARCSARCCLSAINLAYYQQLTAGMRAAIAARRFAEFRAETDGGLGAGRSATALMVD